MLLTEELTAPKKKKKNDLAASKIDVLNL